ncbi:MAG: NAD(P)-dependent oxidoreductase [Peptoniphilaceae bacterium]|nr:NAD(P)-dependent oxidoreductase [Peptoniphilaceae bacterium]
MFRIKRKLTEMTQRGERIDVAILGCGKMGKGLISQLKHVQGIRPAVIVDHTPEKGKKALLGIGVPEENILVTESLEEAQKFLSYNGFIVSSNEEMCYALHPIHAIVEATGVPATGARIALKAIENRKHIIMLNVECDCAVGPLLYQKAQKAGVVYTGTKGDEPGAIMELVDFAMGAGFQIVAIGKGKNNPLDREATDRSLAENAKTSGLSPHMLCSFVDGTNTMTELATVCNATGFVPDVPGCHGITANPQEIAGILCTKEEGGILEKEHVVDYAFGMAPGVFAIVTSSEPEVKGLMDYLGLGKGPNYTLYRPYHLTSLETPITIFDAVIDHEPSLAPIQGQIADVIMVAKRDCKAGEPVKGIGRDTAYGLLVTHAMQQEKNLVPFTICTQETRFTRDIKKGEWITYEDVQLDQNETIVQLRQEQDALGL